MSTQQIKTKSISKLPELNVIQENDLLLISRLTGGAYSSHSTELSTVVRFTNDRISSAIQTQFGLEGMNVGDINSTVQSILSGDIMLSGTKQFSSLPTIYDTELDLDQINDNNLITKQLASSIVNNSGLFIGTDSKSSASPNNGGGHTAEDDNLMRWVFSRGKTESDSTQTCSTSGQLVVYGWLQDMGGVLAQEAWVALYGRIKNKNGVDAWTLLQLQPWPVTARSGIMQYIGFNISVREGLELKIKTGFKVNDTASGTQSGNSLTFVNHKPNSFVGYIIGD